MIISTPQRAHRHNLQDLNMEINFDGTQLEQVPMAKTLGMYLESRGDHVTLTVKTCNSTLSGFRQNS